MSSPGRREVLRTLLSTSVGLSLAASNHGRQNANASEPARERHLLEAVRDHILQAISNREATGVAVAVAHGGRIVWEEGFGWANREKGIKVTPRTPFSLASITKPFTATTLMTLVAERKLSLDEPANRYLAARKIKGSNGDADGATVRQLGAHVSGLPTMFEGYFRNEAPLAPGPETLLRQYGELAYPPGVVYEYSNIGFVALGAIALNLTATGFGTLMTQRVLAPLELHDSFFDTDVSRLPTAAARYDDSGKSIPYYTTSTPESGELYASARDLARFAIFNMKNHVSGRARILEDRWIDELHKPVFLGPNGIATTFGWFTGTLKSGRKVVFKTGGQPGVATLLHMIPSENLAFLVLTNRSNGQALTHSLCGQILAAYLPSSTLPPEDAGAAPSPFLATSDFRGRWEGLLTDGGANMRVQLHIESNDSATLALGAKPAEKITGMLLEGLAFTGMSVGLIEAPDAIRNRAWTLKIKLIPKEGNLVGRVLALAGDPGSMNCMLPYVLNLSRLSK